MNLAIISPIRDEEKTLEIFINSVLGQTIRPTFWLFINDNSSDNSKFIISKHLKEYSFMNIIDYPQINKRETGGRIVEIINYGIEYLLKRNSNWDVLLKLDCDLKIDKADYFEFILKEMGNNSKLGIASGSVYHLEKDTRDYDSRYLWNTQGQSKFYRRECLLQMGGLKPFKGWDMLDDMFARANGFLTKKYFDYSIFHFYKTQTRIEEGGIYAGLRREALAYRNCSYPVFMFFLKSLKLIKKKPYILSGIYFFFYGVFLLISTEPKLNKVERKIVRNFLLKRLLNKIE